MWRNIGVTNRHHWPAAISAFDLTPNAISVGSFVLPPAKAIRIKMKMFNPKKKYVYGVRRVQTA